MPSLAAAGTADTAPRSGLSIAILAVAAFIIVTTEYLIVGLLPALARDLGISISAAGQLVTLFAFTVMLFGPVLTALLSHLARKPLFITILLLFAAANALAAVAPNVWVLALARFIPALALPVFWGTASETAGWLAGPQRAGRAISQVYLGISAALLFGIPLGTLAADAMGWRGTFWVLAGLSLTMALALAVWMPAIAPSPRQALAVQTRLLLNWRFVAQVLLSVLAFTAMFTAYTYLADLLERIVAVPPAQVGWWLMGFGVIGLAGNWLGGRWVEHSPLGATAGFALLLALGMAAFVPLAGFPALLALALAIWGVAYTALFPICQVRVMQAARQAQALAGSLNVAAANAGTGLGAIIGGLVIAQWGLASIGYVAAGIAVLALVMALWMAQRASLPHR
jgi:predicted MFS family arabinose efflux permease